MSDNLPKKNQESKMLDNPLKFKKRPGTTDLGKDYEEYFPSWVILKLLQNKEIKDFRISANNDQYGAFDDVILEVEYTNKPAEYYAVQLKHKDKDYIHINDFKTKKGNLNLQKYYQSFEDGKYKQSLSNYNIILLTNNKSEKVIDMVIDIEIDGEKVKVKLIERTPSSVINTRENGKCYQFQLDPGNSEEREQKYKKFFEQCFLYTDQMNKNQLYDNILQQFRILTLGSSVADKFLKFIHHWSLDDGIKDKLTKDVMVKVVTLNIIDELIHPYTSCNVNEKQRILRKTVSYFNISVFNTDSLDKIVKLWGDVRSILRNCGIIKINEIRKQFQISTKNIKDVDELTDEESTKLLWIMDKCPLIIKHHQAAYNAAQLCRKNSKFIFITDELNDDKLEELTVLKTLSDLKRHQPTYYDDVVKNFTITLFEEKTSFEQLIKEDASCENLITTDEIARLTDNTDLVRLEEEKLCFPYIERHLYKNIISFGYLQNLDKETMVLISNVSDETKLRDGLQNFEIVSIMDELNEDADDTKSKKKHQISNDTFSKKYNQLPNRTDKLQNEFNGEVKNHIRSFDDDSINENTDKLQSDSNNPKTKENSDNSYGALSKKIKLFFKKTDVSPEEFKKLCDKQRKYHRFHHLRYHDEYFEWIESVGDVSKLQKFSIRSDTFVDNEEKYRENIPNKLNIIVGDSGMGKSLFVIKLKNNLLSKYLPVMILPTDVPTLRQFIKHPKNLQELFASILETKFLKFGSFEKQVLKLLMKNKKAVFLWDALDELREQDRIFVEELILTLRENSVTQFLTSRRLLQKQLEDKFTALCQELQPFVDKEQTNYIQERLKTFSEEDLEVIITSIKKNIADTSYRDILGIPLQIYMLTELFLQDYAKYKKRLSELFVITDLYFNFMEEKFNFYFRVKRNYPLTSYKEDTFIQDSLFFRTKNYQQVALKSIFGTNFSIECNTDPDFLNKIKKRGDEFGLITAVDINMQPEFLHKSYAEYFAATYLAENCQNIPNLDIIFERKYSNVKYFFDLLLAKNSPVHVAVLCKNLKYLQDYNAKDELKSKDLQGRNALHLAASWGERYPLLETSEISDDSTLSQKLKKVNKSIFGSTIVINDNIDYETKKESTEYHQIMNILLQNCDSNGVDKLFNFTPSMYAEKSECLFAAAIMGKTKGKTYVKTKDENFVYSLLYYAIKYGFNDVVNLFDDLKFLIIKNGNSILHTAAAINQLKYLEKLLSQEVYRQNINYRNLRGDTALMIAAENGHLETVKYLNQQNAKVDAAAKNGSTPLMVAAENGHLETVEYLVQQSANVNAAANEGQTPLYQAASFGHLEIVKYLKQQNAKVDAAAKNGSTPLMVAAENGHLETVEYLVQQSANVNAAANGGHTPLYQAASFGHLEIVKYLKQQNAKVDAAAKNGSTPLMVAAENGHLETVEYLVQQSANVNAAANEGWTPLYLAAQKGHLETVEYLVQQSANVDAAANQGQTPLYLAAFYGHLETVKYLKQQNAKVDAADEDGFTPLMVAAQNGHLKTVEYLVQQSANVDAAANQGQTPLYLAAWKGHLETVKYLKQQNAKVDAADEKGFTPLMAAADRGHLEIVNYLMQEGANINVTAKDGTTLLWSASYGGLLETVTLLKEQNLNVDAADGDGLTPLMAAAKKGHLDVVRYLIQQKSNINASDKNGLTPLHWASDQGHLSVVELLTASGAKIDVYDIKYETPLKKARVRRHKAIVEFLDQWR